MDGEVLDTLDYGMAVAILDISATCHMPDVIEAPYRPALLGEPAVDPVRRLVAEPAFARAPEDDEDLELVHRWRAS